MMERFTRGMAVQLQAAARQEETELREQRWEGERRSRADRAHAAVRELLRILRPLPPRVRPDDRLDPVLFQARRQRPHHHRLPAQAGLLTSLPTPA